MKYSLIVLMILTGFTFSQLRVAMDLNQELEASFSGISAAVDIEEGISLGYDHMLTDMFGAGAEYQLDRDDDFSVHSVYGIASYNLTDAINGFARVGLNLPSDSDVDGGLCWSIGAGYAFSEKLGFDALYSSYDMEADGFDMTYTRISLGVTYSLW